MSLKRAIEAAAGAQRFIADSARAPCVDSRDIILAALAESIGELILTVYKQGRAIAALSEKLESR